MRKSVIYLSVLLLSFWPVFIQAQISTTPVTVLVEEQAKLIDQISNHSNDTDLVSKLTPLIESKVEHIYKYITTGPSSDIEKEKAIRSMVYLMQEMRDKMIRQKTDIYDIPGAFDSYEQALKLLMSGQSAAALMTPLGPRRSQLLAASFSQYPDYPLLNDIAVYKRVASAPDFILRFLEDKPDFRFADSLLMIAASYDPLKFASHFKKGNSKLTGHVRSIKNPYFRQLVLISSHKSAGELLPFVTELGDNRLSADTILKTRMEVTKYFQLLVNTLIESGARDHSVFQQVLRDGLRKKALSFYVNQVNELHNAKDPVRFASVKGLRPEDLYYIITSSSDELYTSSYLGLYKRLMQYFKKQSADSLFQLVHFDNFRTFMRVAANYNTLGDFLGAMPEEEAAGLVKRFIAGIETDTETGLEKAMDVADSFTGVDSSGQIDLMMDRELRSNLQRCQVSHQFFGVRLYSILLQVFNLVKKQGGISKLWSTLGNYEMLKSEALKDKNGEIVELVLFYGDADGLASFNNFQKQFAERKWEITKNPSWITIRSVSAQPITIYANLPLDNNEELDLRAQDSLTTFLEQQSIQPTVLIHRGHSYHLSNTLKKLTTSVKLAILGSCGAYNSAISIASANPDIQIIGSKKMGSKSINDPIIDEINTTLQNSGDLSWPEIWGKLEAKFHKDEFALNLFNEYIPPGKNVSLFVLKLFNYYNGLPTLAYSINGTN